MAAILTTDEQQQFKSFLDSFDNSTAATVAPEHHTQQFGHGSLARPRTDTDPWQGLQPGLAFSHSHLVRPPTNLTPPPIAGLGQASTAPPIPTTTASSFNFPAFTLPNSSPVTSVPPPPLSKGQPESDTGPRTAVDQDKLERMAQQARELSAWMQAHSSVPQNKTSGQYANSSRDAYEGMNVSAARTSLGGGPPDKGNSWIDSYDRIDPRHQERPPLVPKGHVAADTMALMRQAEERAGFARRVRAANLYESERAGSANGPTSTEVGTGAAAGGNYYGAPRTTSPAVPAHHYSSFAAAQSMAPTSNAPLGFIPPAPGPSRKLLPAQGVSHAAPVAPVPGDDDVIDEDDDDDYEELDKDGDYNQAKPMKKMPVRRSIAQASPAPPRSATKRKTPSSSTPRSRPSASSTRASSAVATSTTLLEQQQNGSADPSINPPPFPTPANIPPTTYVPPPVVRPHAPRPPPAPATNTTTSKSADGTKPALLSAEQKKTNHIASEQKRRAAIRLGYESLCNVVPSLRAAVEEFEARVKKLGHGKNGTSGGRKARGSGTGPIAGPLSGGIEVGGEKVDGRAGPKSEAVVLGKSE